MYSLPSSVRSVKFQRNVWSLITDYLNRLVLDTRNHGGTDIVIVSLNLDSLTTQSTQIGLSKWLKLAGAKGEQLYFIQYLDKGNPANCDYLLFSPKNDFKPIPNLPYFEDYSSHPSTYELGTEYHKIVADFLAVELLLACEYLEWKDRIIISYYVCIGNEFERYLLLLKDGRKEWKIRQDNAMKGFSSGAFFMLNNRLIFIKDRNEVCISTL